MKFKKTVLTLTAFCFYITAFADEHSWKDDNGTYWKFEIVGGEANTECSNLTSITIPNSVISIGGYAFTSCPSLTTVIVKKETPISIGSGTFSNRANAILYVPMGCKSAYEAADYWKEFKEIEEFITFEDSNIEAICLANWDTNGDGYLTLSEAAAVTDLGDVFRFRIFSSFDELQYFTGLTTIGDEAFRGCSGFTSVTIPESVTGIGSSAFEGCI